MPVAVEGEEARKRAAVWREMESCPEELGYPVEGGDVSGLSTIMVAMIQEAKDRISQIEYIFCSQLYPNFQSKSRRLESMCLEAKKNAECLWRAKENDLLCHIEKIHAEKREAVEKCDSLLLELDKVKSLGKLEENKDLLVALQKVRSQEIRIGELVREVQQKSKEVDEGMELQHKLLELIRTKDSMMAENGKLLQVHIEMTNGLRVKVMSFEGELDELKERLRQKSVEIKEEKRSSDNFKRLYDSAISRNEDLQRICEELEKKNKELQCKLKCQEADASQFEKKLRKQTEEVEERRVLQEQLVQQIHTKAMEISDLKQQLEEAKSDKRLVLDKVNGLEKKANELQEKLKRNSFLAEQRDPYNGLLQRIESSAAELLAEKKKRKDIIDAYKRLKSQYNFLCSKFGLTPENMVPQKKLVDESQSLEHQQIPASFPDICKESLDTSVAGCEAKQIKIEKAIGNQLGNNEAVKSSSISNFQSPASGYIARKCPATVRSAPSIGTKRPASRWIGTRSRQCKDGPDPHDDFLDTPLENLRGNLSKAIKAEDHDLHPPVQKGMATDSSDDETQDLNVDSIPKNQQMPVPMAGKNDFKYVEPVRKKAERESLKGVECKQCKKFYDAVLPNNGGKDSGGNKPNLRCEHHDGVSRHRYKYPPPMTPEGFWNIGFESEM